MADEVNTTNPLGEAQGAEAAYKEFLPVALALPRSEIQPYKLDPVLAIHNIKIGLDAVLAHRDELLKRYTAEEIAAFEELPRLALAVVFAAGQAEKLERSDGETLQKLEKARLNRRILLLSAESCAWAGLVPLDEVERIKQGKGPIDTARDCIDLAALFRKYSDVLVGKTPATPQMIEETARLGTELVMTLRPANAPAPQNLTISEAVENRDRLATLLRQRHTDLWKAGAFLFGPEVTERVPALQSRVVAKKEEKPEEKKEEKKEGQAPSCQAEEVKKTEG